MSWTGFNVETLQYKNIKFQVRHPSKMEQWIEGEESGVATDPRLCPPRLCDDAQVWDLGGQTSIRPYWRCYYPNTDAIIFVVDSADVERLNIAKQELTAMLEVSRRRNVLLQL